MLKTKNSIILMLVMLPMLQTFAQRNPLSWERERFFRVGVRGGVNINKIDGKSYKQGFNYNYLLGGFMQFNFSKNIGLQPEVNFVQGTAEFSNDANNVYNDIFLGGSQKNAKLTTLEVPLLLNINLGPTRKIKLQVGPAYGANIKQTVDSLQNNGDIYKKAEWSAIGGFQFQLPLVHFGGRYKFGLTDLNAIDKRDSWRNQAIQIFAGLTF